jgi:Trk-type K+ transport system membrane component
MALGTQLRVYMPVIWAGVVVLVFALMYAAAGNIASGDVGALQSQPTHSPITAFTHSISAFATVGFNTLEPVGWGARLLTAIEAMFGIGLFALFVFTLGNRMRRS